jgi:hypothetical protein
MNALIAATIAGGLALDQTWQPHGQLVVDVLAWLLFLHLLRSTERAQRPALLACLAFATAGEVVLSLAWGLYDYRLGNIPLFVPPGHVLLYCLGTRLAARLPEHAGWGIALAGLVATTVFAMTGRDTLGPLLFAMFLACMAFSRSRRLYATMLALSLAMELWGTWLGNWTWARHVPWLGLVTDNPPLAAGAFYCVLDLLVLATGTALGRMRIASTAPTGRVARATLSPARAP